MYRFDELSVIERGIFQVLSKNVMSLEKIKEFSGVLEVPKALEKLLSLYLVERNKVGAFHLTPAGHLIHRRSFSSESEV